jgi:hypothetical protein
MEIVRGAIEMKITFEGMATVKIIPDTEQEKESLEALWKVLIRCDKDSKVLCPVGAYIASQHEAAQFVIQDA